MSQRAEGTECDLVARSLLRRLGEETPETITKRGSLGHSHIITQGSGTTEGLTDKENVRLCFRMCRQGNK